MFLLAIIAAVMFVTIPSQAQAATDYDNLLQPTPTLTVYTDGATMSQTMDISSTWWRDFKQSYALRVQQNIGWPTNFVTEFERMVSSGGSWGVYAIENPSGKTITIEGTDDPHATCSFGGTSPNIYYGCLAGAGYAAFRAEYFTHNSYGTNGCGYYASYCSDNGMNIYSAPEIMAAAPYSRWVSVITGTNRQPYIMNFDHTYPLGYEGIEIQRQPRLNYVALGDSFSSGEGVEPFISGTDEASPSENRCHRSEKAYPKLLDEDPLLNMTAFVACSGATTSNITDSGQWGEPAQIDALSSTTDIVTITIGGNDIGFGDVLSTCTYLNEPPESWVLGQDAYDEYTCLNAMEDVEGKIYGTTLLEDSGTFNQAITDVLQTVEGSVGEDTKIFIVGYPYLFPTYENIEGSCQWGAYLGAQFTSTRSASEDEVNMLRHVTSILNAQLIDAVEDIDNENITYVDSTTQFENYNLCRWESYITHLNVTINAASYHPNGDGQNAYFNLLKEVIG